MTTRRMKLQGRNVQGRFRGSLSTGGRDRQGCVPAPDIWEQVQALKVSKISRIGTIQPLNCSILRLKTLFLLQGVATSLY